MPTLRCVFCGIDLNASRCIWVRLEDGEFTACPTICPALRERIEAVRARSGVPDAQLALL